ncbi:MAG: thiolase family protein [Aquabacterium sp.]|uniref:thiolase family protein n=1 Tax=Aquabacterium sp. TaxID=1872578 RepID=UPI00271DC50D|nr:thiolase family protein [Aquabacterium sp.]MDO9003974.1 thiolase family protein [Aquabacterium sp.]
MNGSPLEPLILSAVRTPFGRRQGALREVRPDELLAKAIMAALSRSGVPADHVGDVVAGCVSQAGEQGANIARQAVLLAGLPFEVPAVTLNRMCGSSQYAVHAAAQAIAAGDVDFAIGCGVESMSRVPMFLDLTLGRGDFKGFDQLHPQLTARYDIPHQVESAERIGDHWGISRADCDAFAKESHRRAHAARTAHLHQEIVPVPGVDKAGAAIVLDHDEGVRATLDHEKMVAMAPVFRDASSGVVTAANASQMSDGSAAVVLASRAAAQRLGLKPQARILARVVVGSDPVMQLTGVMPATHLVLQKAGLSLADIDWIELNEAFATVALAWAREFEPDMDKLNPWGGAIAHGHPLGGTGAGLMAKMLSGLKATDGTFGLQVMCIGHGMATATIVQRLN